MKSFGRRGLLHLIAAITLIATATFSQRPAIAKGTPAVTGPAAGAVSGSTVSGVIVAPQKVDPPPASHVGFVPPIENPIVELRQYDPFPEIIIYLESAGAVPPEASTPPHTNVVWQLQSHSFTPSVLPVVTGSTVEINNVGRETHLLVAPDHPELKDPIGPDSPRPITVSGKDVAIHITSRSSPHLEGRIVPLPTRFFSRVDRGGKFKVEGVPPGHWTIRVWYRDGWITQAGKAIDTPQKGDVRVELTTEELAEKKEK